MQSDIKILFSCLCAIKVVMISWYLDSSQTMHDLWGAWKYRSKVDDNVHVESYGVYHWQVEKYTWGYHGLVNIDLYITYFSRYHMKGSIFCIQILIRSPYKSFKKQKLSYVKSIYDEFPSACHLNKHGGPLLDPVSKLSKLKADRKFSASKPRTSGAILVDYSYNRV